MPRRPGTLYVFLHGLFVTRQLPNELEIVLPLVSGHMYRAGNWLAETDIQARSVLWLRGVHTGSVRMSDQIDYIIQLPGLTLTRRRRAATLRLPLPAAILQLLRAVDPSGGPVVTINGAGAWPKTAYPKVATVVVLVYSFSDQNEVALQGHYWEPSFVGAASSLHFISTSAGPEGVDHIDATERALYRVLNGYPGMQYKRAFVPAWNAVEDPDFGILPGLGRSIRPGFEDAIVTSPGNAEGFAFSLAELEDIPARTLRLGLLKQDGRPIETLWHDPSPSGVTGDPGACGMLCSS
jgi:hypothetical protein